MPELSQSKTNNEKWTLGSLKEYFEMRFNGLEKNLNERYVSQQKNLETALESNNKRLDGMNEFRDTLRDQAKTFSTNADMGALEDMINLKLDKINESIKRIEISDAVLAGKATQGQMTVAYIVSAVGIALGIINILVRVVVK